MTSPASSSSLPRAATYHYRGDRLTDSPLKGARCIAVKVTNNAGREVCICGRGSMLVLFDGETVPRVVLRRQLRKSHA